MAGFVFIEVVIESYVGQEIVVLDCPRPKSGASIESNAKRTEYVAFAAEERTRKVS